MVGEKEANKSAIMNTSFVVGEKVEIINGPFTKFKGTISSIDSEKDKVKVDVLIFGRPTAVDLTLIDIKKDNG